MDMVENIRAICSEQKMTVKDLEKAAGLSANSIYKWSTNSPSVDKVARVAAVLRIPVDRLIS